MCIRDSGLGDTVKPRLMEADADLEKVLVIDDRDTPLTLADERIARAVSYTHLDVYKRQLPAYRLLYWHNETPNHRATLYKTGQQVRKELPLLSECV